MRIKSALVTAAVLAAPAFAHAAPLTAQQILTGFNAVILGNFTSGDDVEGRIAIGGDVIDGATFYNQPRGAVTVPGFEELNVLGQIRGGNPINLNNGASAIVGGSTNGRILNRNGGGTVTANAGAFFQLSDFTTPINNLRATLSALTPNSTVNSADPNLFSFNSAPDSTGLAVFRLDTALLSTARTILFNLNGADTAVINVTGNYTQTANFNAGFDVNSRLIWNFEDATALSFTFWHGAVLAPLAAVTNSSPIQGTLVAASFTGRGELHDFPFIGTLPGGEPDPEPEPDPVPAPAALALFGLGLGTVAMRGRGRR